MLPSAGVVQQYITHERKDYAERVRAGLRGISQPRSLPNIQADGVLYDPYIIHRAFATGRYLSPSRWPREWRGHPVAAIIKATAGLVCPSKREQVVTLLGRNVRVGVPDEVRSRIVRLINMWDRADPPVHGAVGPHGSKSRWRLRGGRGGGPAGAAGEEGGKSEAEGTGTEPGVKRKGSGEQGSNRRAQERKAAAGRVIQWLSELPSRRGAGEQKEE